MCVETSVEVCAVTGVLTCVVVMIGCMCVCVKTRLECCGVCV